jgi:hypothetical protein
MPEELLETIQQARPRLDASTVIGRCAMGGVAVQEPDILATLDRFAAGRVPLAARGAAGPRAADRRRAGDPPQDAW